MIGVALSLLLGTGGCRTPGVPATEAGVDKEVTKQPAPSTSSPEENKEAPIPGFDQEPSGTQTP